MSLDVDAMKVFVRVAQLRSFTQAAEQLAMPKARASAHVQKLERQLGVSLLQRSTRVVRLTPEGEQLLEKAQAFVAEAEELSTLFQVARGIRGRVRVELPIAIARELIIPRVPELLARHPQLQLDICASDRIVAALREGFDLVLRIGVVNDPALTGRLLGEMAMSNYVSPAYVQKRGRPRTLDDLRDHFVVHYGSDPVPTFEYVDGNENREVPMRSLLTVDNVDAYVAACIAGLGIVQVPRHDPVRSAHQLVEVLPDHTARAMPVTLLHTHGRSAPRRVRAVMTWLIEVLTASLSGLVKAR